MSEVFSSKQKEIFNELGRIDSKLARAYEGALRVLLNTENPDRFSQAANSIRHIGGIISRLSVPTKEKLGMKDKIGNFLVGDRQIIPLPPRIEIEKLLKEWYNLHDYFHSIAHYGTETNEIEFQKKFSRLEDILIYFLKPKKKILDELDLILKKEIPSDEDLNNLKEVLIHPNYVWYFFSKLNSPKWFNPLKQARFFSSPPEIIQEAGELSASPSWPQANYLKNISTLVPQEILEIIQEHTKLNNPRVLEQFVDCLILIPVDHGKKLLKPIKSWIYNTSSSLLLSKIAKLSVKFYKEGEEDTAFDLIKTLLETIIEKKEKKTSIQDPYHGLWELQRIIKEDLPEISQKKVCQTLLMLCDLLVNALDKKNFKNIDNDRSNIWRPAIEDHSQNAGYMELKNILLEFIKDGFERLGKNQEDSFKECFTLLKKYNYLVFKRLRMHLMKIFPHLLSDEIVNTLSSNQSYEENFQSYEFYHLMAQEYKNLPLKLKKEIWDWIQKGPNIDEFQGWYQKGEGVSPSKEIIQEYIENWQIKRLSAIKNDLIDEQRQFWDKLISKHGEPEHPDFAFYSTTSIGPTSPITKQDLEKMAPIEILEYLKKWQPSENLEGPEKWGLAREFEKIVVKNPQIFIEKIIEIKQLDLIYIYYFFSGLGNAIKDKKEFNWNPVISFGLEILTDLEYQNQNLEKEPFDDWTNLKREIGWFLENGLISNSSPPIELKDNIWSIIKVLLEDEDPSLEDQEKYLRDMDYNNFAINTVRGIGIDLIGSYASWCARNLNLSEGDKLVPEVKSELLRVLDPNIEPVASMWAVGCKYLTNLHGMNRQWVKDHLVHFFPKEKSLRNFWRAAWEGYINYSTIYKSVYEDLHTVYVDAINDLSSPKLSSQAKDALASHLLKAYLNKLEDLSENSLIISFFKLAPDESRHHFMWAIGKYLSLFKKSANQNDTKQSFIERIKEIWGWRIEKIRQGKEILQEYKEIGLYGFWFIQNQLDMDWAIKQLLTTLELTGGFIDFSSDVINNLEAYLADYPTYVLGSLILLLKRVEGELLVYIASNKIEGYIKQIKTNPITPELQQKVNTIVDLMIKNGKMEFKEYFIQ